MEEGGLDHWNCGGLPGVAGVGRVDAKRVDSALDQGPLSLARREKTRIRRGWSWLKGVRDEESCGGHE